MAAFPSPDDPLRQPDEDLRYITPALGGGLALLTAPVSGVGGNVVPNTGSGRTEVSGVQGDVDASTNNGDAK